MKAGLGYEAIGTTSNRILLSNIQNNFDLPNNVISKTLECETTTYHQVRKLGHPRIVTVPLGLFGMGGFFNAQQCYSTYNSKIQEGLMAAEEIASRSSFTLKIQYSTVFPGGTCSSLSPLVTYAGKKFNMKPLSMVIVPNNNAPSYQLYNVINCLALMSGPVILVEESYGQSIPEEMKRRAGYCVDKPSNFNYSGQFSYEFAYTLAKLISGDPPEKTEGTKGNEEREDDFAFLDATENKGRNQIMEIESEIGGRNGLYVMHYSRTLEPNFEESSILKPGIQPSDPKDILIIAKYDCSIPEDQVINDITSALERQQLTASRFYCMPSSTNETYALISTNVPYRLKNMINHVKGTKSLREVLERRYRKTILANVCPIMRGSEAKILKERMSNIFFQDKSHWEDYMKKQGHLDPDELAKTNFSCYLGKEHDVFLKPVGYEE